MRSYVISSDCNGEAYDVLQSFFRMMSNSSGPGYLLSPVILSFVVDSHIGQFICLSFEMECYGLGIFL